MDKADSSRQDSKWETLERDILSVIFRKLNVEDLTMGAYLSASPDDEILISAAASQWKNLKTLIIAHDDPLRETFEFQVVGESCSNLTNLKYLGCLGKESAEKIVSYLKNIGRLKLDDETVTMDDIVQAATQKRVKFILCSNNCTGCRNERWLEGVGSYGSESWRNDEIKELEF
ncbi:hypothetical protein HA466_0322030 [Hirschfeldia incana]|nr:hypothetical protein HA466_0322030 [Hirschfeldia incana]